MTAQGHSDNFRRNKEFLAVLVASQEEKKKRVSNYFNKVYTPGSKGEEPLVEDEVKLPHSSAPLLILVVP